MRRGCGPIFFSKLRNSPQLLGYCNSSSLVSVCCVHVFWNMCVVLMSSSLLTHILSNFIMSNFILASLASLSLVASKEWGTVPGITIVVVSDFVQKKKINTCV